MGMPSLSSLLQMAMNDKHGCVPSLRELSLKKKIFCLMGNSRAPLQRLTVYPNSQKI